MMHVFAIKSATIFKVIRLLEENGSPFNEILEFFGKSVKEMDENEKY